MIKKEQERKDEVAKEFARTIGELSKDSMKAGIETGAAPMLAGMRFGFDTIHDSREWRRRHV